MKLNLEEQEETIEPVEKTDLIYGIDDRPPFKEALFAALQHLLAIFVAIITPPLIIAGALKLDLETTGFLAVSYTHLRRHRKHSSEEKAVHMSPT